MKPLILIFLAVIGFVISAYIYFHKKYHKPLYCPMGDCNEVVNTKYGRAFGFENTAIGMAYYALILIYGIGLFLNRNLFKSDVVYYFSVGASATAVAFSVYLAGVQAFVIKKWCFYCISSTITVILILVVLING